MKELYQNTMIWPGEKLSGRKNTFKDEEQIELFIRTAPEASKKSYDLWRNITLINSWHQNEYESAAM